MGNAYFRQLTEKTGKLLLRALEKIRTGSEISPAPTSADEPRVLTDTTGSAVATELGTLLTGMKTGIDGKAAGPVSSTVDHVATFSDATGKVLKDSGYTIGKSVPSNAVFTDTTYESKPASSGGTAESLVTTGEKYNWNSKIDFVEKGAASGVAELDANGKVPSSQLPSYVDDVEEYDAKDFTSWAEWVGGTSYAVGDKAKITDNGTVTGYICKTANSSAVFDPTEWDEATKFPTTGEAGKIYIAKDTNITYRWGGSAYVPICSDLALGETSSTAYRGDRGKQAYDEAVVNPDSTPTANSNHLVKSGGVASAIAAAKPTLAYDSTTQTLTLTFQ